MPYTQDQVKRFAILTKNFQKRKQLLPVLIIISRPQWDWLIYYYLMKLTVHEPLRRRRPSGLRVG